MSQVGPCDVPEGWGWWSGTESRRVSLGRATEDAGAAMRETIWFLKHHPLFERLTPAELARLERGAVMRKFPRRDLIYFPTDAGQSILVLAKGRVKLKDVSPDGKETIIAFIDEGDIFGELALLDDEPRREFAEAVEECLVLAIPCADFLQVMDGRPDLAMSISKLVGVRRRRIEARLRNLLFRSNRERLAHILLELVQSHGERVGGRWQIRLRLTHQDLAGLIGATRETVTLTLGQFQKDRLIEVHRRQIVVVDYGRLAAEVHAPPGPPAPVGPATRKNRQW